MRTSLFLRFLQSFVGPSKVRAYRSFVSTPLSSSTLEQASDPSSYNGDDADVDWDNLGFSPRPTDFMYIMKCCQDGNFVQGKLSRHANIELSPFAGVLNYGQGIFEGLKANRKEDGSLLLFRPDQHAIRMKIGAERMCLPSPSIDQFIHAAKQTVIANDRWVPPPRKGSLYIRPLLFGSGPVLGVGPAAEFVFLTYASPVGNYFKQGKAPLNLYVEEDSVRAFPGGVGGVKTVSNYGPVMQALLRAKSQGFSDVLYLDSVNKKYLEEVSASNIFILKGNVISTPPTSGTILPGITRKSIIEIARDLGYQVEERAIWVNELREADEVFCTGTAVGVASVGSVTYKGRRTEFKVAENSACQALGSTLVGIQTGLIDDNKGWIFNISLHH
ncbi:Branched-chain-amino-acid aminotransferase 2 [Hibiscus syriacus]|uniref:Branched-chain-amino-acid aminotransferase n=1 Tax=Hibiscus syriacus TaxID=106335 RepID=A0A6A3BE98_HIBSY|nr:branched-chain-amino-acid aminotransferase 2, chloroplastic-like [Hibiscus syriacus]KAE8714377.1 Branched-chain-amino-acid aminotransferase 2 [Hibiscus syriacus]